MQTSTLPLVVISSANQVHSAWASILWSAMAPDHQQKVGPRLVSATGSKRLRGFIYGFEKKKENKGFSEQTVFDLINRMI